MVKVAVLGAGINGVACASRIKEAYKDFDVTIISEQFSPHTTGDGSGGLWFPYLSSDTPLHLLEKWGGETYNFVHKLFLQGGLNISMAPVYAMYRSKVDEPGWRDTVFGFTNLNEKQMKYFNELWNSNFVIGHTFTTFVIPPTAMITYLFHQFTKAGGKALQAKVTSLQDPLLQSYDVIINCTGLGAREIVPDRRVMPIRGQVLRVQAPWQYHVLLDQDPGYYIIPNWKVCVLGGTRQKNNFNMNVDPKDTANIVKRCTSLIPSLKEAPVSETWVGLRPGCECVQIHSQYIDEKLVIHNYGHGMLWLAYTLRTGCKVCGESFTTSVEMKLHHRREHARKRPKNYGKKPSQRTWPTNCDLCSTVIPNARSYWTHYRRAHPDKAYPIQKNYVCDVCGKSFRGNAFLVYHKRTHSTERAYKCDLCPKAFFNRANLQMHEKTHSDRRPYPCSVCCKAFKSKGSLDRHFRSHTGVKPYECDVCGKGFAQSNSRKLHMRTVHLKLPAPYVSRNRLEKKKQTVAQTPTETHYIVNYS